MTYRITGLDPLAFAELHDLDDGELAGRNARRVVATNTPGYPCRVTLEDAEAGETLILVHHVSHDVATPFRASHAIYVRAGGEAAEYVDSVPPVFEHRTLSLRGFAADGMLHAASLALPGEADARIRDLLADEAIAYIHAHNAVPGCFAAKVDRT